MCEYLLFLKLISISFLSTIKFHENLRLCAIPMEIALSLTCRSQECKDDDPVDEEEDKDDEGPKGL